MRTALRVTLPVLLLLTLGVRVGAAQVRCDRFEIIHSLTGHTLTVKLDTDLPDDTIVMVGVSRSYFEKGDTNAYPLDYFQERATVGAWRQAHRIDISHGVWQAAYQKRSQEVAAAGIGGVLARIDSAVEIRMTVPIRQPSTKFGTQNAKLSGKAVTTEGTWHLVRKTVRVPYPLPR